MPTRRALTFDSLDAAVADWTARRPAEAAAEALPAAGVAAHVVSSNEDLMTDQA